MNQSTYQFYTTWTILGAVWCTGLLSDYPSFSFADENIDRRQAYSITARYIAPTTAGAIPMKCQYRLERTTPLITPTGSNPLPQAYNLNVANTTSVCDVEVLTGR